MVLCFAEAVLEGFKNSVSLGISAPELETLFPIFEGGAFGPQVKCYTTE